MSRVLVIDDSALMRKITRDSLEEAGFEVEELLPMAASELINHLNLHPVDLVISDYNMPALNGEGITRAVRFLNPKTPIIILTAIRDAARDAKLKAMGVREIRYKPISSEDLVSLVTKTCKQQLA